MSIFLLILGFRFIDSASRFGFKKIDFYKIGLPHYFFVEIGLIFEQKQLKSVCKLQQFAKSMRLRLHGSQKCSFSLCK